MAFLQFLITIILLLNIIVRTYSVSNEDIHSAFSNIPRLFYTTDSNPAFSGYSYTTQDFNGGGSNVVFTTGADAVSRLKSEMNLIKMQETYSQRDTLDKTQENLISSKQQSESEEVEASMNKQEDYVLNSETFNEDKKLSSNSEVDNNIAIHQETPQQISSFVRAPYPVFRENLLNLHFPAVFPRYQVSNVIQNQYYPSNPYARLELPLHNFGFYNPAVPLFYQPAIPDNSFSHTSTANKDTKESVESHVSQKSKINATSSASNSIESSVIKSRSNLKLMTKAIEETSSAESATSTNTESTTIYEKATKKISNTTINPTTESSVKQATENNAKSTELNLLSSIASINKYNTTEETSTNKI